MEPQAWASLRLLLEFSITFWEWYVASIDLEVNGHHLSMLCLCVTKCMAHHRSIDEASVQ
jgi:hypothetical protein